MDHRRLGRPPHPEILTPAEQRVLAELRRGGTNAEIAERLGIGRETVKTHIPRRRAPRSARPGRAMRGTKVCSRLRGAGAASAPRGHSRPIASIANATSILSRVACAGPARSCGASDSGSGAGLYARRYAARMSTTGQKSSRDSRAMRSRERMPPARISRAGASPERTAPSCSTAG